MWPLYQCVISDLKAYNFTIKIYAPLSTPNVWPTITMYNLIIKEAYCLMHTDCLGMDMASTGSEIIGISLLG